MGQFPLRTKSKSNPLGLSQYVNPCNNTVHCQKLHVLEYSATLFSVKRLSWPHLSELCTVTLSWQGTWARVAHFMIRTTTTMMVMLCDESVDDDEGAQS